MVMCAAGITEQARLITVGFTCGRVTHLRQIELK